MSSLVAFKNIRKSFGAVRALRGVDFELRPGEVHAVVGENGAGKSTLIKIATGAVQPDAGEISLDGAVVPSLTPAAARARGIACIYQQPALFPDLSVAENIGLRLEPARAWRCVDWPQRRAAALAWLRRIGANISVEREAGALSLSEQQLVEIASAIGAGARVMIMDEPTASLTRQEQDRLYGIVRELRAGGTGVIYISHRLEEIFALADRVTVLRDGESVATHVAAGLDEATLIRWMVGRQLDQLYPETGDKFGEPGLRLDRVSCADSGVADVSLEVRAGEVFGLAGLVGAGRTELARILFGLTPATSGEISIHGQPVNLHSPREAIAHGIAYVPEDRRRHGIVPELSVAENITMAIGPRLFSGGWLREAAERRLADEYIERFAIKTFGRAMPVFTLSGGNQQKVALARWLATEPKILILDEPTQGVDVGSKSEIHHLVRTLANQGIAVLLISSDLPEVIGMSDRIGVMRGGRLIDVLPGKSPAEKIMAAALGRGGTEGSA